MAYSVEYSPEAQRQLDKLDRPIASRIIKLMDRVQELPDPRAIGEALHGGLKAFWKYRAGDWRVVASIHDRVLVVEVIEVAHRSGAY